MADSKFVPDYEAGVLKELKCPRCSEYMLPPIKLCESGHNICSSCRPELSTCPTCNKAILNVNNISLENLAGEINFPCKYLKSGCGEQLTFSDLRQHQAECSFGNHNCPFARISKEKCNWCGRLSDMIKHIKEAHMQDTETLSADGSIIFQISIPSPVVWNQEFAFTPNLSFSPVAKDSAENKVGERRTDSEPEEKSGEFGSSKQATPESGIQTQEPGSKNISAASTGSIFGSLSFGPSFTPTKKASTRSSSFGIPPRRSTLVASVPTTPVSSGSPFTSNSAPATSNSTTVSSGFTPFASKFGSFAPNSARQVILALEQLFYVVFRVEQDKLYSIVIHVGPREESSKFKYRLTLSSKHEAVTFTLITTSYMDDINSVFLSKNWVQITSVSRFAKNSKLKPKIEILRCEENQREEERDRENEEDGIREVTDKVKDLTLVKSS